MPSRVPRAAERLARGEQRPARRRDPREGRDQPAADVRQHRREAGIRPRRASGGADGRRVALRAVPAPLLLGSRVSRRGRRRLRARADARARARLLRADDLGVRRAGRGRAELALGRRALRRPRRGDRRPAGGRRRLRRGHRAARARARGRRSETRRADDRRLLRPRRSAARARRRLVAGAARARCLVRHRLRGAVAQGPAHAGRPPRGVGHRRRRERTQRRSAAPTAPTRPSRSTTSSRGSWDELARPPVRRAASRARRPDADARRLGRAPPRPRRADLRRPPRPQRDDPARGEPRERARGGRAREADPERVRPPGDGRDRRSRAGDRESEHADRRGRAAGVVALDRLALDAAPVPARRGRRRRDAPAPLPLARPAPRADAAESPDAGEARLDHPRGDGGGGVRRHRDADHGEADSRGRPRLPRPDAPAAGEVLRAAAVAADLQAAPRDLGLRPLLPDRALLPGRGPARRPPPGADAARRGDGVPGRGGDLRADGADRPAHLAGDDRRRARDALPEDVVAGGGASLRIRQARPPLRARDPGRDRDHAGVGVRRLRERRSRSLPERAAGALSHRRPEARGHGEAVGGEGPRLCRVPRRRRGQLADREVPLGAGARGVSRAGDDGALRRRHAEARREGARAPAAPPRP